MQSKERELSKYHASIKQDGKNLSTVHCANENLVFRNASKSS